MNCSVIVASMFLFCHHSSIGNVIVEKKSRLRCHDPTQCFAPSESWLSFLFLCCQSVCLSIFSLLTQPQDISRLQSYLGFSRYLDLIGSLEHLQVFVIFAYSCVCFFSFQFVLPFAKEMDVLHHLNCHRLWDSELEVLVCVAVAVVDTHGEMNYWVKGSYISCNPEFHLWFRAILGSSDDRVLSSKASCCCTASHPVYTCHNMHFQLRETAFKYVGDFSRRNSTAGVYVCFWGFRVGAQIDFRSLSRIFYC